MLQHAILTAMGADRPGLVAEVSQFIFQSGANIEDSRMVNLRGQFAMVVLVSGDEAVLSGLRDRLESFSQASQIKATLTRVPPRAAEAAMAMPYRLTATAMDQAGLVHQITALLRKMNVNIESMETVLSPAPITGAPMFEMELLMSVPKQTPIGKLRDELGKLCDELNIDYRLSAV